MIQSTSEKPSHSRLSTLYSCERKYYYSYELGISAKDRSFAPMIAGKAGHAGLDKYFTHDVLWPENPAKQEDWRDAIHDAWGDHRFRGDFSWLSADFMEGVVEQYIEARRPLGLSEAVGAKVLESELEGLIEIAPGIEIVVKIDLVVEYPDGTLGIVDHKFTTGYLGVGHYADLAYGYQLCMYAMAAEKMLDRECRQGAGNLIYMGDKALLPSSTIRKKGHTTTQKWQWAYDDLRFMYDDARREECIEWIRTGISRMSMRSTDWAKQELSIWPKSPSSNCNSCEFNELCAISDVQDRKLRQHKSYKEKSYE